MSTLARSVVLVCLLCAAIGPAAAGAMEAPSFLGYTGLLLVPSADTLSMSHWNVGAFTTEITGDDTNLLGATAGLPRGLEAGVLWVDPDNSPSETVLHAKYRLEPLLTGGAAIAVGIFDVTDEIDSNLYVTFSKSLTPSTVVSTRRLLDPTLHLGIGSGGTLDGLFAGLSAVAIERLTLMAEYDSDDVNFGARLAIAPKVQAHAGWLGDDSEFAVGVSFNQAY